MSTTIQQVSSSSRYYEDVEEQTKPVTVSANVTQTGTHLLGGVTVASVSRGIVAHAGVESVVISGKTAVLKSKKFVCLDIITPGHFDAHCQVVLTDDGGNGSGGFRIIKDSDGTVVLESGSGDPIPQIAFAPGSSVHIG